MGTTGAEAAWSRKYIEFYEGPHYGRAGLCWKQAHGRGRDECPALEPLLENVDAKVAQKSLRAMVAKAVGPDT